MTFDEMFKTLSELALTIDSAVSPMLEAYPELLQQKRNLELECENLRQQLATLSRPLTVDELFALVDGEIARRGLVVERDALLRERDHLRSEIDVLKRMLPDAEQTALILAAYLDQAQQATAALSAETRRADVAEETLKYAQDRLNAWPQFMSSDRVHPGLLALRFEDWFRSERHQQP